MRKPLQVAPFIVVLLLSYNGLFAQSKIKTDTVRNVDILENQVLHEVVVSASRRSESILKAPVTIETFNSRDIRLSAAPSFFDALENVKGVQMLTPSMGFKIINTRGFANTTNVRFTQLVDGIDNQAPHIGAPIGNAMGPNDLDIEKVEIIPGTASALYGLNAINGLANFITKNPFTTTGITIQQKTGITHVNDPQSPAKLFSETSLRIAEKISSRLAYKVNFTYTKGYDWIANDRTDLNATANSGVGIGGGINNPANDPVNGYGNESSNRRRITLGGRQYQVSRTGYDEKDMTDYDIKNVKADIGLHYKLSDKTLLSYTYRIAGINNVYQRANRFALKDYMLQQHAVELKSEIFQARGFVTTENTGKSYNLRSAAENQDRKFKNDNQWYADYTSAFNNAIGQSGTTAAQALARARIAADQGRLQPGTPAFQNSLNELAGINNWDQGAALRVKDNLAHAEAQADISKAIGNQFREKTGLDLLAGLDYVVYFIHPDGNYFINPAEGKTFDTFTYGKTGAFVQARKNVLKNRVSVTATLRVDKNDYFEAKLNPRFTAVITPYKNQSIRISYQSGSRFPSIFEAFSNVNSGGVRRVGGLKVMSDGVFENAYLRSSVDQFQAAVTNDFNNGISTADAIRRQKQLLIKNYYTYLKPEHITSMEIGYKGLFLDRTLKIDADFYYNKYNNFIAQVEMNVPNTILPDSIPTALNDRNRQSRYRLYTNSRSVVYNLGGSLGMNYLFLERYTIGGNLAYAKLSRTENNDGFEDGFNTPEWISNVSLAGEHVIKSLSFLVMYKYQNSYYWQSFLVNGQVKSYGNIDAQLSYDLMKTKLRIKLGATNLLNNYYYSYLGGPSVGGMYYTTLTYQL
ncbi:TonB-dependent receptor [Pedobacter metabolipauper]|uniref:Iron complex outermembrane receptor protein n=1 Tax=Pedobacter metabolipauper TaxID=425513 RepID=A0A4R6STL5_9SPHI|nr:TonB-dependent receptor [Pedobacter metabolipauper]TDQ08707.1 iron complex outermembrane receptor protein [Pedobacter metabolipauper]